MTKVTWFGSLAPTVFSTNWAIRVCSFKTELGKDCPIVGLVWGGPTDGRFLCLTSSLEDEPWHWEWWSDACTIIMEVWSGLGFEFVFPEVMFLLDDTIVWLATFRMWQMVDKLTRACRQLADLWSSHVWIKTFWVIRLYEGRCNGTLSMVHVFQQ